MEMADLSCSEIPKLVSSFVDTFVDFTVSGFFLLPDPEPNPAPLRTRYPAADRLVAIGDLHGDLHKTRHSFRLAGLIDASDRWTGGSTTVVQIGDVLDRGGDELRILYFIEKLKREAARSGGLVISMNGNHEIMNVDGDFRYVTHQGLQEFEAWARWYSLGSRMKSLCHLQHTAHNLFDGIPLSFRGVKEEFSAGFRARIAALRPSGPISRRFLGGNATVVMVGESVFVHGGLLAEHVAYGMERMNEEVRQWIVNGVGRCYSPPYCRGRNGVVWLRSFSEEREDKCECWMLDHVLSTIPGAKRMVMGHTIQHSGINAACADRAVRIDVGMSRGCINAVPQVLEILHDSRLRILIPNPNTDHAHDTILYSDTPIFTPTPVQVQA